MFMSSLAYLLHKEKNTQLIVFLNYHIQNYLLLLSVYPFQRYTSDKH